MSEKKKRQRPNADLLVTIRFRKSHDVYNAGDVTARDPRVAEVLVVNGIAEVVTPEQLAAEEKVKQEKRDARLAAERQRLLDAKRAFDAGQAARAKQSDDAKKAAEAEREAKQRAKQQKLADEAKKAAEKAEKLAKEAGEVSKSSDGPPKDKQVKGAPLKK